MLFCFVVAADGRRGGSVLSLSIVYFCQVRVSALVVTVDEQENSFYCPNVFAAVLLIQLSACAGVMVLDSAGMAWYGGARERKSWVINGSRGFGNSV